MECDFVIRELLAETDSSGVCVSAWDSRRLSALDAQSRERMGDIINVMGRRSCKAQGLAASITDWTRMSSGPHRLYIAARRSRVCGPRGSKKALTVLGILKTGRKHLFLRMSDMSATLREVEPLCVLDFYVHESLQRQGIGSKLMTAFFREEGMSAESVAYDRPSSKLIAFLRKHYGLQDYANQTNNYVVFRKFWELERKSQPPRQQQEDRSRQRQRGNGGGTWSTINQRPLSGAKKQGRSRRQYAPQVVHDHYHQQQYSHQQHNHQHVSPQHSPRCAGGAGENSRYGCGHGYAHSGYDASPMASHVEYRGNGGSVTSSGYGSHPQFGRRAQRYDNAGDDSGGGVMSSLRQHHVPRYGGQQQQQQQHRHDSSENDDIERKTAKYGRRAREKDDYVITQNKYSGYYTSEKLSSASPMSASPPPCRVSSTLHSTATGTNIIRGGLGGGFHGSARNSLSVTNGLGFARLNAPF